MNRRIIGLFTLLCLMMTFLGCHTSKESLQPKSATDIPYVVAQRYFVKNNVRQSPPLSITDSETFEAYFGTAAVMGANGHPTPINFDTHYVITVTRPTTTLATELTPVSLQRDNNGTIVFTYQMTSGEQRSYSTTPCLLIIVDKSQQGPIRLNEQSNTTSKQ